MMKGFVNPYNFIKFPKKKAEAYPDEDCHTGVINYTITTKTPLFIPNSSSDCALASQMRYKIISHMISSPTQSWTERNAMRMNTMFR